MSYHIIIPARMQSTRLPNKPLALLNGIPMIVRVAQRAQLTKAQQVIVTSDSQEIAAACRDYGIEFVRSKAEHPSGTDRIAEVCARLELDDEAIVVNVQGDEPLIPPELIESVAQQLLLNRAHAISTAAHTLEFADFNKTSAVKVVLDKSGQALYFSRAAIPCPKDSSSLEQWQNGSIASQYLPLKHIGIYGYRAGFLRLFPQLEVAPIEQIESLEQLRAMWHGYKIQVAIYPHQLPPGVDTPEDLAKVRAIIARSK